LHRADPADPRLPRISGCTSWPIDRKNPWRKSSIDPAYFKAAPLVSAATPPQHPKGPPNDRHRRQFRTKEVVIASIVPSSSSANASIRPVAKFSPRNGGGDFSRVEADARAQVEAGAHMLDVNAGIPLADEPAILARAVQLVQSITDVPLSIDSSIVAALEAASRCTRARRWSTP